MVCGAVPILPRFKSNKNMWDVKIIISGFMFCNIIVKSGASEVAGKRG